MTDNESMKALKNKEIIARLVGGLLVVAYGAFGLFWPAEAKTFLWLPLLLAAGWLLSIYAFSRNRRSKSN
jgi:uncharacterized membrane protein HdeD (DUF308 family)